MRKLEELKKLAEENQKITKNLVKTIGRIGNLIADLCPNETEIFVNEKVLWIEEVKSKLSDEKFLMIYSKYPGAITDFAPGEVYYLYGDYNARIEVATIEDFKWVAKNIEIILEEFTKKIEQDNTQIKESLKKINKELSKTIDKIE